MAGVSGGGRPDEAGAVNASDRSGLTFSPHWHPAMLLTLVQVSRAIVFETLVCLDRAI